MKNDIDKEINLRPLWDALLDVYKVIADICDRHSLCFCAGYGTALGAVRHGGFIPWDDDLDLLMPRPDYERFIEIAKIELPEGLAWLDMNNCKSYDNPFGKVIVTDEKIVERVSSKSKIPLGYGIFVDIFPVDGYPKTKIERVLRQIENIIVEMKVRAFNFNKEKMTIKSKMAAMVGVFFFPFYKNIKIHRDQSKFYQSRAIKQPFGSASLCVPIGLGYYYDDKPHLFEYWNNLKLLSFENTSIPVFEKVDEYLTAEYGDFMKLPPVEKRKKGAHGILSIMPWRLGPNKYNLHKKD